MTTPLPPHAASGAGLQVAVSSATLRTILKCIASPEGVDFEWCRSHSGDILEHVWPTS